jgi:hypothetical protein
VQPSSRGRVGPDRTADPEFVFVTGDIAALPDPEHEFGAMPVLTKPFVAIDLDRLLGEMDLVIS